MQKLMIYNDRKANKSTIMLLHFFLGWSYGSLDKIGLQVLYYVTFHGFFIWWFIRWFTIADDVKAYNRKIAMQCGMTDEEMNQQGLLS